MEIRSTFYDPYGKGWVSGMAGPSGTASARRAEGVPSTSTDVARTTRRAEATPADPSSALTAEERAFLDQLFPSDRVGRGVRSYRAHQLASGADVGLGRQVDLRR